VRFLKNRLQKQDFGIFIGSGVVDFDTFKTGSKGRPKVERVFETFWRKTWGRFCSKLTYRWFFETLENFKNESKKLLKNFIENMKNLMRFFIFVRCYLVWNHNPRRESRFGHRKFSLKLRYQDRESLKSVSSIKTKSIETDVLKVRQVVNL